MLTLRLFALSAILFWVGGDVPDATADPASPTGQGAAIVPSRATVALLPGGAVAICRQLDGSLICTTSESVLRSSSASPARWSDVALEKSGPPGEMLAHRDAYAALVLKAVGGERDCAYFTAQGQDERFLCVLEAGKAFRKIRALSDSCEAAAFATKKVGAISDGCDLLLTTDGGATWHPAPPVVNKGLSIQRLLWISPTRLLVGADDESLRLLERTGDYGVRSLWKTSVGPLGARQIAPDGDYVWAGDRTLHRLRIADGQIAAVLKPDINVRATAVCHKSLLVWDDDSVEIWAPNAGGTKYALAGRVQCEFAAAIFPLEARKCLVVTAPGRAVLLDLGSRRPSPFELQVSLAPPPPKTTDATMALTEELGAMISLSRKVPSARADAILEESDRKPDLSPRQRVIWATGELRRAIKEQGGPIAPPPPPTAEEVVAAKKEMRTELELGKQIPFAQTKIIVEEAVKNANLTDRERRQWIIKKYREYLATHKPDPDVNRTDATHEELVAMWALGAKVPDADRNVIFAEQRKKTEMTDLQKTRWATEQFRKYIDEHKAKDDKDTKKNAKD